MVYVKKWVDFHAQCVELFSRSPEQTRYLIKATPSQQWLILKVTDDSTCLKFRGRSAIIINRFEAFTRDMTAIMAGLPLPSAATTVAVASNNAQAMDVDGGDSGTKAKTGAANGATNSGAQQGATAGGTGGGGGGGKKKKKKGKK